MSANDEQAQFLQEALNNVKTSAFQMKRSLDNGKLMEAIRFATAILNELRTSLLSPKTYYELYMAICDELRHLEAFLVDEFEKGRRVSDLYELVQYVANIVPRLYLLVTVGSVYVKAKQIPTRDIMRDLVEMCRGVQHPLRGLFIRNYLLGSIKGELPTALESTDGTVHDSIDFILLNFAEMNKLWVRMQHQGHSRDRKRREQERMQLRILVGTNLVRLSGLDNVDVELYRSRILPPILEQVVKCRDPIAQEYLMECIIQVFPDEFHLQTLDVFLAACGQVSLAVNVKVVIQSIMDRLAAFATRDDAQVPSDINLFEIFSKQIDGVIQNRPEMPFEDILALQISLIRLAIKCYPTQLELVDQVLKYTSSKLKEREMTDIDVGTKVCSELQQLTKLVFDEYDSVNTTLKLANLPELVKYFAFVPYHDLAVSVIRKVLEKGSTLVDGHEVSVMCDIIMPLVKDHPDQPKDYMDEEDFAYEQEHVSCLISSFQADARDVQYQMLSTAKKIFAEGGVKRMKHTVPPLCFKAFKLAGEYYAAQDEDEAWSKKIAKIYQFCHQLITTLAEAGYHELSLRLFFQAAASVNRTPFEKAEAIAYELMSQGFLIYEEEISDSKLQLELIHMMIGTLEYMSIFTEDNFNPFSTKCALLSSKLIKKPDQCRSVATSANLFWTGKTAEDGERRDEKQVFKCLQKALKIAKGCLDPVVQAALYVEVYDVYLLFNNRGCSSVAKHIPAIHNLIKETINDLEDSDAVKDIKSHFARTTGFVKQLKDSGNEGVADVEV